MLSCEAAVIGAGPYGLAIAAHLRAERLETLVFGQVMSFWKRNMPKGMLLRSPWAGSHIGDPSRALTLDHFAATQGGERREPLPLQFFVRYGEWFQRAGVPDVDERFVSRIECVPNGFVLLLEDGEAVRARQVVIATGLEGHEYRPPQFAELPPELASHSSEHGSLAYFVGKRVVVIGAGQSALESAALLLEAGAEVHLVARANAIHWIGSRPDVGRVRRELQSVAHGLSAPAQIGPFPLNWLIEQPDIVRLLPPELKHAISARGLRPSGASWLAPRIGSLRVQTGRVVLSAAQVGDRAVLKFDNRSELSANHVLLATGYRIDIGGYRFLPPELGARLASTDRYPVLSRGMESSLPGLYFAGAAAVSSFGPLMRFVAGSGFAGQRIARQAALRAKKPAVRGTRVFLPKHVVSETEAPAAASRDVTPLTAVSKRT
jgi:hypothetical protein